MLLLPLALAYDAGRTGSSVTGCTSCHARSADSTTTATLASDVTEVYPGDAIDITFTVSTTSSSRIAAGLDISASGGTLGAGSNTRATGGEITHNSATAMTSSSVTFDFTWTAPSTEGDYTLYGAGNAVNDNNQSTGDGWNLDTLTLTVDDGCDDLDGDFYDNCTGDCDDADPSVNPGADELCDGLDQDCDDEIDEDPIDGTTTYVDVDEDGYGDRDSAWAECEPTSGRTETGGDCDDGNPSVSPDGIETCDDVDQDCDGTIDDDAADAATFFRDNDADGYGDASVTMATCDLPDGYSLDATDCDDTRAETNPLALELCDDADRDEDCDGAADDADDSASGQIAWFVDGDGDGYGDGTPALACAAPDGTVSVEGDCNDADSAYNPAAVEACDSTVDYNCDGSTGFADADGDGFAACLECDDSDAAVNSDATEVCNLLDDDCDGTVDEADATDASVWYADTDNDGYGDAATTVTACSRPEGYVADAADCSDASADVRPGAVEVWYDGIDQDCDGNDTDQDGDGFHQDTDCDDTTASTYPGAADAWYDGVDSDCATNSDFDADADGHDSASFGGADCDDALADVYPGAPDEPYDGVITDCDDADEYDADDDGFDLAYDCDDNNSAINPGAAETWYDGLDQDCDGNDTDQDGDGLALDADCDDEDADILECDTSTPVDDTGPGVEEEKEEPKDEGCGCDVGGGATVGALVWGAVIALRRRRVSSSL